MKGEEGVKIAKTLKAIEDLKLKIIQGISEVYTAIYKGTEDQLQQKAAKLIIYMYSLSKNSGYSYRSLDREVLRQAEDMRRTEDAEYLDELVQYLKIRGE
ncbi:MazG-like family protein [Proteinivorax hydrogeniformans]|uniref:MazG-like family protein n=1 Tax=Proteinivorax hydrogeniformans TaxID=1826727 RepID=A0AAU8HTB7_9FIRM